MARTVRARLAWTLALTAATLVTACSKAPQADPPAVASATTADNPDIGLDPKLPANSNVDRVQDATIPGEVKPEEAASPGGGLEGKPTSPSAPLRPGFAPPGGMPGMPGGPGSGGGQGLGVGKGMGGLAGRGGASRDKLVREGGGNRLGDGRAVPPKGALDAARKDPNNPDPKADDSTPGSESYDRIVENPFVLVGQSALSTFSSDVDTASYSNVRRFLLDGRLPPKDAVRIEEMMNSFSYDYPAPTGEHPVAISPELTTCPWNPNHKLLRIGVQSKVIDPRELPSRNLVFLLDTSGSMSPENRLPLLKQTLALLVDQLNDKDRVSIVVYAGSAGLILPPTPGSDKATIKGALDRLHSGGSTNGGAGIELAYKIAQDSFIAGGVNRVIIGTDGDFNVGVSNQGDLVRMIEDKRKAGVFLTVLGFGMGNLKDSTLEKLAHHGNGHYAYIDDLPEAKKMFVDRGASLVTVAKDVKFQVEFNPKHVAAYRLVGYENRILAHQDFNDDAKDAGDMGSGHTVTALYELVPAGAKVEIPGIDPLKYQQPKPTEAGNSDEWLTVKLRYKDADAETSKLLSVPVGAKDLKPTPSDDAEFAVAVAAFGMLLRDSQYKGSYTLAGVAEIAGSAVGKDAGGHRAEFVALVKKTIDLSKK